MAERLAARAAEVLEANTRDMHAARADGVRDALLDRLRLDDARLGAMADQLRVLADVPAEPSRRTIRDLPGGLRLAECRRPADVIVADFEARPNVVVDAGVTLAGGTSCCRGSGGCWPGWASAVRCRRTPTRLAASRRWTPGTRRR